MQGKKGLFTSWGLCLVTGSILLDRLLWDYAPSAAVSNRLKVVGDQGDDSYKDACTKPNGLCAISETHIVEVVL